MHAAPQDARAFIREMKSRIASTPRVAELKLHEITIEEFRSADCDRLRFHFWLGDNQVDSDEFMITFTSNLSVEENIAELESFVKLQYQP